MGNSWEPGNPKGWGDPTPLVLMILLLVMIGGLVGGIDNYQARQERCRELLQQPRSSL